MLKINNRNLKISILKMAVPASFEVVLQMLLGLIDVIFVSWLGETELAGVGIANRVSSLMLMISGTIGVGGAILIAQYYGKNDGVAISKISAQLLQYSVGVTCIFGFPLYLYSDELVRLMGAEGKVVEVSSVYFKIIVISMGFGLLSIMSSSVFRSIGNTKTPMLVNTFCLAVNTILNYVLIFGLLFIPAMGVEGCAYATLIARFLAFSILIFYMYKPRINTSLSFRDLATFDLLIFRRILKISYAVMLGELSWAIGVFSYTVFFTNLGTDALVASHIVFTLEEVFIMFSFGIVVAGMTMVGHEMGSKTIASMRETANEIFRLGLYSSIFFGTLLAVCSVFVGYIFTDISSEILEMAAWAIVFFAIFQPVKVSNFIFCNGILKGGGDVNYVMYVDAFCVFVVGLPMAYYLGFTLEKGFYGVCVARILEEVVKFFLIYSRFKGDRWYRYLAH